MAAPIYTTCVERKDYETLSFTPEILIAIGSFLLFGGVGIFGSVVAVMAALHKLCEYILHGKLVCLGGDRCAVGRVAGFETVDDKGGLEKIDNDFSVNLLLAPYDLEYFTSESLPSSIIKEISELKTQEERTERLIKEVFNSKYNLVVQEPKQGKLIQEQSDMPMPREAKEDKKYSPTSVEFPDRNYITYDPFLGSRGIPYRVPILHCEIEGERANLVCSALDLPLSLIPGGSALCRFKLFGIPIGRWICAIISTLLLPIILAALAIAWAAGSDDNRDFDGAGDLSRGEGVIIRGRWVYDAGHSGWNELHPVISIQKLSEQEKKDNLEGTFTWGKFDEVYERWCKRSNEVPPIIDTGLRPLGMTPEQESVYDQQRQPENRWVFHPIIDGCERSERPSDDQPRDPVIR
jgi:hypothetical protein